ncbi:GAF and ANTAR domain-containing protein [Amycolatopsis cynarae]|uniref:GAF and ANTAR domain-containing protein n=1 Tax=Amycolatopsis cynarae TaxID=2995223 RepID=A0ABY7B813_9PSEU|nr:GAF and ANTAR domain-containing protein [Amycolatopsis sp. HUAS 11-8]WAL66893.1 GAF and ANTAR domain-containing protein [Amycolatopsis sp. HUAS 11-8]
MTGALDSLTDLLQQEDDFHLLLRQVCAQVTRAVPGVEEATVTLLADGVPQTAAATRKALLDVDNEQYRTGDGPCLEAAKTGEIVRVAVGEARDRWPAFARVAEDAGVMSFLSAPLRVNAGNSGAINCYSTRPGGFADLDARLLNLYTVTVSAACRSHLRYLEARALAEGLRSALDSRAVIEQAKGILMAARGLTADEAFTVLVRQSQRENLKLRTVAERFVAKVSGSPARDR